MLKTEIINAFPRLSADDRREIFRMFADLIVEEQERPTLLGQVLGNWFSGEVATPKKRPGYPPDGAILPWGTTVGTMEENIVALTLVRSRGRWWPLYEAALYTYHYTSDLNAGLPCWFMPVAGHCPSDPCLYSVKWGTPLSQGEVVQQYGDEAGARARDDYPTIQLLLSRVEL